MTYKNHVIIGGIFGMLFNVPVVPSMIGAVLPDIDLKWSKMYCGNGLFTSHRGITHHAIVGAIGLLSIFLIPIFIHLPTLYNDILKGFIVGYISHLFADTMTKSGIPYWKHKDRISVKLFRTRSTGEYVFVSVLLLLTIFYAVIENQLPYELKFAHNMIKEALSGIWYNHS
jgi:inner membrane protein